MLQALDEAAVGHWCRTAVEALAAGAPPREVWLALCDDMDVPEGRRHGREVPRGR